MIRNESRPVGSFNTIHFSSLANTEKNNQLDYSETDASKFKLGVEPSFDLEVLKWLFVSSIEMRVTPFESRGSKEQNDIKYKYVGYLVLEL